MIERMWYFAYGSNMQPATFAGRRGITPSQALAARAPGWCLTLDKTPLIPLATSFANLLPDPDAETFGVLYEISAEDLTHIDLTEGVLIDNYRRVEIPVVPLTVTGPNRAYTLVSDKRSADLQPSAAYMALLIEGAEIHGLPPAWIARLRAVPTCVASPEVSAGRRLVEASLAGLRRSRD